MPASKHLSNHELICIEDQAFQSSINACARKTGPLQKLEDGSQSDSKPSSKRLEWTPSLLPSGPSYHQLLMQRAAGAFSLCFVFVFSFLNNAAQFSFSKVFVDSHVKCKPRVVQQPFMVASLYRSFQASGGLWPSPPEHPIPSFISLDLTLERD